MENDNEKIVNENAEEVEEIKETQDELGNDTTDWKTLALKNQGIAKRFKTKVEKFKEAEKAKVEEPIVSEKPQDKKEFGDADKAYWMANGIKRNEFDYIKDTLLKTGKTFDELWDSGWFQKELTEKRTEETTNGAIPKGSKRGGESPKDSLEYWIGKDELPPSDQPELRRQVVNEKIKRQKQGSKFTDRPIG